jgi:IclR family acetate operon transcriptional repressor
MGRDGQSVIEKAARVLDCYIESGESSLGYAELLEATEINRASLHRTLGEMAEHGILVQDGQRERYRLGPLLRSAAALAAVAGVPGAARPHLTRLRDECRETVVLAELHDTHVVPVLRVDGLYEIRMNQEVGRRYPAHAGATGKVLIANLPDDERLDLLARLELDRLTDTTTVNRSALRTELKRISELGVAVTIGERVPDAVAISAPVFDAEGRVVAALTIGGIASRYERDALVAHALAVIEAAAGISAELGHRTGPEQTKTREQLSTEGSRARAALDEMCAEAWSAATQASG